MGKSLEPHQHLVRRERLKAHGLCVSCGRLARKGLTQCQKCADRRSRPKADSRYAARRMLVYAKERAGKAGLPVTITYEWIKARLDLGWCQATGLAFDFSAANGRWMRRLAPSLDRIDNAQGYTPENTQVVVWHYNCAKGHWTEEDFLDLARRRLAFLAAKEASQ